MHLIEMTTGPVIFAAVSLLLLTSPGLAADAATCDAYSTEAVIKAQGVRQFACGYDLKDPRWTEDRKGHARWCEATQQDVVVGEMTRRRGEMKQCQQCRAYATLATAAAADNSKLKCGLTGPRWSGDAQAHFGWCMALRVSEAAAPVAASDKSTPAAMDKSLSIETADRISAIDQCRSRPRGSRKVPPRS
jgi:hypothetical protein